MKMKRKRKNACPSPILDSPKRTKVHAQRKFAQGSNVNSPVITPIRELESESTQDDILPEPVELLPIKRPNTEDFLTFLCFRGTPILPPTLNFFNTASIVDTNGQVHEIKSESSPKNGPIDIAKCGSSSSDKPFVAFGVRKRADPIVISRQMDRKRRHALALQTLRRKYQEQKMAKIRALTISKLSEKITNKTLIKTNTTKTETVTKKTIVQKTKKHIKVTTIKMKQNMCLRSFRGRFIQQELPFRKRVLPKEKKLPARKKSNDKIDKIFKSKKQTKVPVKTSIKKIVPTTNKIDSRSTRSNRITNIKTEIRKQIKRILIPTNPNAIIKPKTRSLRLTTMKKSVISRRQNRTTKTKPKPQKNKKITKNNKKIENVKKIERPTRKTKEAATIYMELLSNKLINNNKCDDDNNSIDSFPDLPNVKKTQQLENELKLTKINKDNNQEDSDESFYIKLDSDDEPLSNRRKKIQNKRECAKLPQNYLPMLSSSDEDETFHGFDEKSEINLLNKEKVNMSNEQIEKWLKDSANSINKNNLDILKYNTIIPTDTNLNTANIIDTEKLKEALLGESKKIIKPKLIFRNKSKITPNINAFSPENESSIYAFGEENDTINTPFRRPSRRPSSTATSDDDEKNFFVPQNPIKSKYKIPTSPSASSSSSTKKKKILSPAYTSDFPKLNEPSKLVEAPIFHPTDQEFLDPLEYIERIRHKAEQFGICKIIPPASFKPDCKVSDDMRFTAYNQYVGKMLYRWGPNFKEFMVIKKYLETQNITLNHPPWIGGMEIDLPRLYQTVQTLGGLKEVIEKKKWSKVSELMKIPKSAQDRVTKLDDIYCKYLLPYDTLSPDEREKLFDEVETEWVKKESRNLVKTQDDKSDEKESDIDDDTDECITKGRNMALNAFYRIARNTMSMYFKTNEPLPQEVEQEYWKYVMQRQNHICVHSGSIDSGNWGYGFPITKNTPFAKHPWNLKMLTNNNASVLRSLGPLMGVTVPTLHVGMVFSACCWYRDPHGLPWIEYLHTGGTKIWYGIPNSMGEQFHSCLKNLVPNYCKNKELWLPSDTIMVPPEVLVENNVSLCHTIQEPGEFIVVFPKVFTSNISTSYVVSESVFFAPIYWLKTAKILFDALKKSNEPAMFSFDRLLVTIVNDAKCNLEIVRQTLPLICELCNEELVKREKLEKFGQVIKEKLNIPDVNKGKKKKFLQADDGDYECDVCRCSLFLSMIFDTIEGITYCLDHAYEMFEKKELELSNCKFMFTHNNEELKQLPEKARAALDSRSQKKIPNNKFSGMPTLLGKYN